nr:glycine N-acyltransferase isoform X3 [Crassostrea gigas]
MAVRQVLPEEYDELDQKLEKELPLSILGLVHFRLMRSKHLLREKMVLVDSWPHVSVLVIVDRQMRGTVPFAAGFCRGPDFASTLDTLIQTASKGLSPPVYFVGCSTDVIDALIGQYKSANTCPFRKDHSNNFVYALPAENIVPLAMPDGFRETELTERHLDAVIKAWPYSEEMDKIASVEKWFRYTISNFPTVCIETDDGRPVAWEMQQEYGGLGVLHVEPEYGRNKLGSIVSRTLAKKLTKEGQLVFACVDESNVPSIAFHEKNGYVRLPFKFSFIGYFFEANK